MGLRERCSPLDTGPHVSAACPCSYLPHKMRELRKCQDSPLHPNSSESNKKDLKRLSLNCIVTSMLLLLPTQA